METTNDLLARLNDHPDLVVEGVMGIENWQKGKVTMLVHGDGKVEIVNARAGKEFRFSHRLAPDAVKAYGAVLAAAGLDTLKSRPGPREPGDTPVVLRLLRGTKVLASASVWYADRYDLPALDKVVESWEALVKESTKGELPF